MLVPAGRTAVIIGPEAARGAEGAVIIAEAAEIMARAVIAAAIVGTAIPIPVRPVAVKPAVRPNQVPAGEPFPGFVIFGAAPVPPVAKVAAIGVALAAIRQVCRWRRRGRGRLRRPDPGPSSRSAG